LPSHGMTEGYEGYQRTIEARRRELVNEVPAVPTLPKLGPLENCRKAQKKTPDGYTLLTVIC